MSRTAATTKEVIITIASVATAQLLLDRLRLEPFPQAVGPLAHPPPSQHRAAAQGVRPQAREPLDCDAQPGLPNRRQFLQVQLQKVDSGGPFAALRIGGERR